MNSPTKLTSDETMQLISAHAKESGTDAFILKLYRRAKNGMLENLATFYDATISHFASAESWVSRLFGGGDYAMTCSPMSDQGRRVGSYVMCSFAGDPIQPNARVLESNDWMGPTNLQFLASTNKAVNNPFLTGLPTQAVVQPPQPQGYFVPGQGFVPAGSAQAQALGLGMQTGYGVPQAQSGLSSQPSVSAAVPQWNGPAQQAQQTAQMGNAADTSASRHIIDALAARERELSEKEARIAKSQAEKEMQLRTLETEQRMRAEFESKQRELEAKLSALAKPREDGMSVDKMIAAATPLVTAFMAQQAANREMLLKLQADSDARRDAQQAQFLALVSQPKPGMTPEMQMLIETLRSQAQNGSSGPVAEMMTQMVNAMSTVSRTSIGMVEAIADMNLGGQPENPILAAVKEGVKAIATLSAGTSNGARRIAQQSQQRLPPGMSPAQVQQMQQQQFMQQQAAQQGMARPIQQPPAPLAPQPPAQHVPVPIIQPHIEPVPNVPQAFDGAQPGSQAQGGPTAPTTGLHSLVGPGQNVKDVFQGHAPADVIEGLIRSKYEPVEAVANLFFDSLELDEMKDLMMAHDGEIDSLLQERLGDWLSGSDEKGVNLEYLKKLGFAIDEIGMQRGVLTAEDGDDGAEASEGAEG